MNRPRPDLRAWLLSARHDPHVRDLPVDELIALAVAELDATTEQVRSALADLRSEP